MEFMKLITKITMMRTSKIRNKKYIKRFRIKNNERIKNKQNIQSIKSGERKK